MKYNIRIREIEYEDERKLIEFVVTDKDGVELERRLLNSWFWVNAAKKRWKRREILEKDLEKMA